MVAKRPDPASKNLRVGSDTHAEFVDAAFSIDGFVASVSAAFHHRDTPKGVSSDAEKFAGALGIVMRMVEAMMLHRTDRFARRLRKQNAFA